MTPFALLIRLAGLSQGEAASFLDMSRSSVDKFSRGSHEPRPGVLAELRALVARQMETADAILDEIGGIVEQTGEAPEDIEIGYPVDDHEAQSLGWPSAATWWGMAAHVVAGTDRPIKFVPRGSTVATAGASDARELDESG